MIIGDLLTINNVCESRKANDSISNAHFSFKDNSPWLPSKEKAK